MKLWSTLAGCSLLVSLAAAAANGRGQILKRTLQEKGEATPKRKTQIADWSSLTKLFEQRPDASMLKLLTQNPGKFNDGLLSALVNTMSKEDAAFAFEHMKFLETMPAYKAFAATGNTDPTAVAAAQLNAFKDLATSAIKLGSQALSPDGTKKLGESLIKDAESDDELQMNLDALQSGDGTAFSGVSQSFANKYLGGVDMKAFTASANDWADTARKEYFADGKDLPRLLGDDDILSVLQSPLTKMLDPEIASDADAYGRHLTAMHPGINRRR